MEQWNPPPFNLVPILYNPAPYEVYLNKLNHDRSVPGGFKRVAINLI